MTFEVIYDGARGENIIYNERWNIVAADKKMVEALFRLKARKAGINVMRIHSIEKVV